MSRRPRTENRPDRHRGSVSEAFVKGVPYGQDKARGDKAAAELWSAEVIRQTNNMKRVTHACAMNVTFLLPEQVPPKSIWQ